MLGITQVCTDMVSLWCEFLCVSPAGLVLSAKYFTMLALTWFLFGVNPLNGKHGKVTIYYFSVLEGWCLVEYGEEA